MYRNLVPYDFDGEFDNIFDSLKSKMLEVFNTRGAFNDFVSKSSFPKTNIFYRGKDMIIEFAIPGYHPEDINITLTDGVLEVVGKSVNDNIEGDRYAIRDISKRAFTTSWRLPKGVTEDRIKSEYDKGILTVTVKDVAEEQPKLESKRIPIEFKKKKK